MNRQHLHHDDHPATLMLLNALVGHRRDLTALGIEATDYGAYVDWDAITNAFALSSTERAVARIAQGSAVLERHGGPPPHLARLLRDVINQITK